MCVCGRAHAARLLHEDLFTLLLHRRRQCRSDAIPRTHSLVVHAGIFSAKVMTAVLGR
jgi:hypothetical protein